MPGRMSLRRLALTWVPALAGVAMAASTSCSTASDATPSGDSDLVDTGTDSRIQTFDIGDETPAKASLCGELERCDPDYPTICTVIAPKDSGIDDGASDASEASDASDDAVDAVDDTTFDAPSLLACRVVRIDNKLTAACAPAGKAGENDLCSSDDVCAPGLACVGDDPGAGRCLRYCCKEAASPSTKSGTHYCTPRRLAARTEDRVPVWVKLDNCTLLEDELQCPKGTACTVVTNDGKTTCVPRGTGRDGARCETDACDRGYVCMGSAERRCRKICVTGPKGSGGCADAGVCQALPTMPTGYGICPE